MPLPAAHTRPEVRFGLVVEGDVVPRWQARCIEELLAVRGAAPCVWIVVHTPSDAALRPRDSDASLLWRWLAGTRHVRPPPAFDPTGVARALGRVPRLDVSATRDRNGRLAMPESVAADVAARGAHLLLDLTEGGVARRLRDALPHGVWTFHFGDTSGSRRRLPTGFREIMEGSAATAAALVCHGGGGAGAYVLHAGRLPAMSDSLAQTRAAAYMGVAKWPARQCRALIAGAAAARERTAAVDRVTPTPESAPTGIELTRAAIRIGARYVAGLARELFRHPRWALGVVRRPAHALLEGGGPLPVEWVPATRRDTFLADPFGFVEDGELRILAEEFDYATRCGVITAVLGVGSGEVTRTSPAMTFPVHASYPYLLEDSGDIYCIPETCEAREVRLLRLRRFPDDWEDLGPMVEDFPAADATAFRHGGLWWLFCVDAGAEPHTHLHAWWSERLRGPWTPHALNPLKSDPGSSRPAGTPLDHDGRLYLPAQDCTRTYGGAVVMNRVLRLTPTEYAEEPGPAVTPDPGWPYPDGLHTIASVGDLTLIDAKRTVFVPREFRRVLRRRLASLLGRARPEARGFYREGLDPSPAALTRARAPASAAR